MAAAQQLSQKEVNQRTAVLRRFKELLKAQRDRFQTYLEALDKSREVIEQGTAEDLLRHVELEEKIVADIYSIQKVIDPLEHMYRAARPSVRDPGGDSVSGLKSALEGLKTETALRTERNRALLSKRMTELRNEIKTLRSNPYTRKQPGFSGPGTASRVDIRG
jgi:DNA-binding transcriptional MerR regulator